MARALASAALLVAACAPDTERSWAFDPIELRPTEEGGVTGFQTWELFSEKWDKNHAEKHYICAVVVEFEGAVTSCTSCVAAWEVTTSVLESDCDAAIVDDPMFTSLVGIGLGNLSEDPAAPHPGSTSEGRADYGAGWETHGLAWPKTLDEGGTAGAAWDGVEPFTLWPTAAWPLEI